MHSVGVASWQWRLDFGPWTRYELLRMRGAGTHYWSCMNCSNILLTLLCVDMAKLADWSSVRSSRLLLDTVRVPVLSSDSSLWRLLHTLVFTNSYDVGPKARQMPRMHVYSLINSAGACDLVTAALRKPRGVLFDRHEGPVALSEVAVECRESFDFTPSYAACGLRRCRM